jgi:HAMP domain-containing protein
VEWDDSAESWGIDLICQIRDPVSNQYLGQIKAVFNYGMFIQNFVEVNEVDVYEIKVTDQSGTIVATSETDKTKVNNEDISLASLDFYNDIDEGTTSGSSYVTDEDGENVYIGYAVSDDVNQHVVVVSKRQSDVQGPIDAFVGNLKGDIEDRGSKLGTDILMVGIAVGVAIVGAGAAVIHTRISRPVKKLNKLSRKLSNGEIEGLTVDVKGKDEIGQLGESFQGVLAAFNYLNDELKTKERQEKMQEMAPARKHSPKPEKVASRSS